jgi:Transglycosylase SLT domain
VSVPAPPSQYATYIQSAASGTGIPQGVVQAQAFTESGYNPAAVSPAGAEGFWQFLPSTYNAVASQAGVPQGTEFNVADETKAYIVYMNQLLSEEGGNVFKALEAYNAGPGNLSAGASYATQIEKEAGVSQSTSAGQSTPSNVQTAGISFPNPLGGIASLLDPMTWLKDIGSWILGGFGLSSAKDLWQRLGLILLGVALILVGVRILSSGTGGSKSAPVNITEENEERSPVSKSRKTTVESGSKAATKTGAGDAIEAAAVA